jgi:UDP-N-acetylglucosamine--N-acetylmuramyl-(pentapeptide) pyrophosphoryl-undecaprenol N-acetylglucosamine transferase
MALSRTGLTLMRALIAAGGTGGHIYPGIAVAKEIMRRDTQSEVRFVGTARGLETRLVPNAGFELSLIESAGLVNMGIEARVRGLAILPKSFFKARRLLKEFDPDVVVGAGGYVSGPVLLTAAVMRIPTLVMESNAVPGFTNRMLARWVDRAAASFETALPYFRGKGVVTGNPVRREFFDIPAKHRDTSQFRVLVFGGSQGARAINNAMVEALPYLEGQREVLRITHQTGETDFERITRGYADSGWSKNAEVLRYIDDMVGQFARADLIVSRAGATTSFELMASGKAAIMVPLPGQMEQQRNAETMQKAGAARMILQPELSGERLAREIAGLVASPETITQMETASRNGARRDAAETAVDLMEELVARRGKLASGQGAVVGR